MKIVMTLILVATAVCGQAQGIAGKILNEKKEEVINAAVQVFQGGILKGGSKTDYDGNYVIKPLEPGYYDLVAVHPEYDSSLICRVAVSGDNNSKVNIDLRFSRSGNPTFTVTQYKIPLIDHSDQPIVKRPIDDIISAASGTYQSKRGQVINMTGARVPYPIYIVEGVKVRGSEYAEIIKADKTTPKATFNTPGNYTLSRDDLRKLPATEINNVTSTLPGVYQQRRGDELHIYGSR